MITNTRHKVLVMRLKDPSRVLTIIPTAKPFLYRGQELTVVPHGMTEYRLLKNLNLNPPHPVDTYYNWPGAFAPMATQRETVRFLTAHNRAYCLNDLGTGKTIASLWAFDFLREQGLAKRLLVVAPLSTMERTWGDEVFRHFSHLHFVTLHGTSDRRRMLLRTPKVDVFIINHDGVKVIKEALVERTDIDTVAIDEIAQVARNAQTDRWKALKALVDKRERVWGLTGTPTPNAPTDAWAQCRLLTPSTVPTFFASFRDMTMRQTSTYSWAIRDEAMDIVHQAMQPAIRFSRDECVDLPPVMYETREAPLSKDQQAAYDSMMSQLYAEFQGGTITAVNEAVKAMKLVQICCIAYNTEVLTARGWVAIQDVSAGDLVWDGDLWVSQGGAIYRGEKPVVEIRGTYMTLDHKVWVGEWVTAEDILYANAGERLDRATVRLPDGYTQGGNHPRKYTVCDLGVPVRLRNDSHPGEPVPAEEMPYAPAQLRLPPRQRNTQTVTYPGKPHLPQHGTQVPLSKRQGLPQLRRAWHRGVRALARSVRELLGGYAVWLCNELTVGAGEQRRTLLSRELPVGDYQATGTQQEEHNLVGDSYRESVDGGCSGGVWGEVPHATGANTAGVASGACTRRTYDLINCGPNNRFVVRGGSGIPLIVHNCGSVRGDNDTIVTIPPKARVNALLDIIEEAPSKVIVFVPFKAALRALHAEVSKYHAAEMIYSEVSKNDRDRILGNFQKSDQPRVLIAQPAAMSHGLTLTAASVIVWFAPITSAETYEQANGRITRPGQVHNQLIMHIQGSRLEDRMYTRLTKKVALQGTLLDMFKEGYSA